MVFIANSYSNINIGALPYAEIFAKKNVHAGANLEATLHVSTVTTLD